HRHRRDARGARPTRLTPTRSLNDPRRDRGCDRSENGDGFNEWRGSADHKRTTGGVAIGGWLLKANPDVWDVLGHLAAGRVIDSWGVAQGYRADLMEPGDRCFVWVTGPRGASWTPGIWAAGVITARPVPTRERRRLRVG